MRLFNWFRKKKKEEIKKEDYFPSIKTPTRNYFNSLKESKQTTDDDYRPNKMGDDSNDLLNPLNPASPLNPLTHIGIYNQDDYSSQPDYSASQDYSPSDYSDNSSIGSAGTDGAIIGGDIGTSSIDSGSSSFDSGSSFDSSSSF